MTGSSWSRTRTSSCSSTSPFSKRSRFRRCPSVHRPDLGPRCSSCTLIGPAWASRTSPQPLVPRRWSLQQASCLGNPSPSNLSSECQRGSVGSVLSLALVDMPTGSVLCTQVPKRERPHYICGEQPGGQGDHHDPEVGAEWNGRRGTKPA